MYSKSEPYKQCTYSRKPITHPIITSHFILSGKLRSDYWEKLLILEIYQNSKMLS